MVRSEWGKIGSEWTLRFGLKLSAWQWDASARFGWNSKAIERIRETAKEHDMNLYECLVDSCHCSREEKEPCHHAWKILAKSKELYQGLERRKCPGQKDHSVAQNRVACPQKLAEDIADAVGWEMRCQYPSLRDDVLDFAKGNGGHSVDDQGANTSEPGCARDVMSLHRASFPVEKPTGKRLEEIKNQMMKLRKASGYGSFDNLARLLERRGTPDWAVSLVKELKCPECSEEKRVGLVPPSSVE